MPASLIIIAALTCFILWFRCLLLSIALGYDLQWQVLEVRRQPLITQLQLVEAETCWWAVAGRAPACSWGTRCQVSNSQEGTDWDLPIPSCLDDLSCPSLSILFLLPALPSIKSPRAKIFTSCLNHFFILKVIFWDWRDWLHRGRSKSKVNAYLQAAFALCLLRRSAAEERHSSTVASSPLFVTLKIH